MRFEKDFEKVFQKVFLVGGLALCLGLAIPAQAAIQLRAEAFPPSGVAPLAVFFDASTTLADGVELPFHQLDYRWDFGSLAQSGSAANGVWAVTGLPKQRATGALAGHVFEKPGEYRVMLRVRSHKGDTAALALTVKVEDPAIVFAGSKTVCFSRVGNFTGCPAGAESVQPGTGDIRAALKPRMAPGTRLLLRRGEAWTAEWDIELDRAGPGLIGSFGEGELPRITIGPGHEAAFWISKGFSDWRLQDLLIDGGGQAQTVAVGGSAVAKQLLCLRLQVRNAGAGFVLDADPKALHQGLAIVECVIPSLVETPRGGGAIYILAEKTLILGNDFDNASQGEHVIRTPHLEKAVIAHNKLARAAITKQLLKLHGPPAASGRATTQVLFADNVLRAHVNAWPVAAAPQNGEEDERLRDVIIERNYFAHSNGVTTALYIHARDVTVRNNIFDLTGATGEHVFTVTRRSSAPAPDGIRILNNTLYRPQGGDFVALAVRTATRVELSGNLAYAPGARNPTWVDGDTSKVATARNLWAESNPFAASTPALAADFRLKAKGTEFNLGELSPFLGEDFAGAPRLPGQAGQVGAFAGGTALGLKPWSGIARPGTIRSLRASRATWFLPVIFGTGRTVDGRLVRGCCSGADPRIGG